MMLLNVAARSKLQKEMSLFCRTGAWREELNPSTCSFSLTNMHQSTTGTQICKQYMKMSCCYCVYQIHKHCSYVTRCFLSAEWSAACRSLTSLPVFFTARRVLPWTLWTNAPCGDPTASLKSAPLTPIFTSMTQVTPGRGFIDVNGIVLRTQSRETSEQLLLSREIHHGTKAWHTSPLIMYIIYIFLCLFINHILYFSIFTDFT